jgi:hypothetical protein
MRFTKKQLSLWRIVLIIGVTAIAIPIATRDSPTAIALVKERQDYLPQQTTVDNEDADAKDSKNSKAAVGEGVARHQDDDYYERRREYWEKRVERRLDHREEYLDEQTRDDSDADAKGSKAGKDKKDSKDAADDEEDVDDVDREIARRREYWRKRVDKEW